MVSRTPHSTPELRYDTARVESQGQEKFNIVGQVICNGKPHLVTLEFSGKAIEDNKIIQQLFQEHAESALQAMNVVIEKQVLQSGESFSVDHGEKKFVYKTPDKGEFTYQQNQIVHKTVEGKELVYSVDSINEKLKALDDTSSSENAKKSDHLNKLLGTLEKVNEAIANIFEKKEPVDKSPLNSRDSRRSSVASTIQGSEKDVGRSSPDQKNTPSEDGSEFHSEPPPNFYDATESPPQEDIFERNSLTSTLSSQESEKDVGRRSPTPEDFEADAPSEDSSDSVRVALKHEPPPQNEAPNDQSASAHPSEDIPDFSGNPPEHEPPPQEDVADSPPYSAPVLEGSQSVSSVEHAQVNPPEQRIVNVPGDGNCFFYSMILTMKKNEHALNLPAPVQSAIQKFQVPVDEMVTRLQGNLEQGDALNAIKVDFRDSVDGLRGAVCQWLRKNYKTNPEIRHLLSKAILEHNPNILRWIQEEEENIATFEVLKEELGAEVGLLNEKQAECWEKIAILRSLEIVIPEVEDLYEDDIPVYPDETIEAFITASMSEQVFADECHITALAKLCQVTIIVDEGGKRSINPGEIVSIPVARRGEHFQAVI